MDLQRSNYADFRVLSVYARPRVCSWRSNPSLNSTLMYVGTIRNLRDGCHSFSDILDLAADHLVYTGEAPSVER